MLHLRKDTSYVTEHDTVSAQVKKEWMPMVPLAKETPMYKFRYNQWLLRYEDDVEDMWNTLVESLYEMKQSERFVCHYDMTSLKEEFKKLAYETSDSTYKSFI